MGVADGLKVESVVNLDHLYTVPQDELRVFVGHLTPARMGEVCAAVSIALGCS